LECFREVFFSTGTMEWAVAPPSWISATLIVGGKRHELDKPDIREFKLGRNQDICIEHQTASRFHAIIAHHREGGLYIVDQRSANGTFVDGKEIGPNSPVRLNNGSVIKFGDCPEKFQVEIFDRREGPKKDMMSQLAGYDDDALDDGEGAVFVSAGYRGTDSQRNSNRGSERNYSDTRRFDRGDRSHGQSSRDRLDLPSRGREREDDKEKSGFAEKRGKWGGASNFSTSGDSASSGNTGFQAKSGPMQSAAPTGAGVSDLAQKRKMLWGTKAKEENTKNTAAWTSLSTTLGNSDAQDRFLKLMGGKKPENEVAGDVSGVAGCDIGGMQSKLEREFQSALHRSQGNSKHGLG
jgi:pSer/pThr/pTyr-binding forkhead associated (FHA) protein